MANTGSIIVRADIDISREGISIRLPGVDSDLAELIKDAEYYQTIEVTSIGMGNSDVHIRSMKAISFIDRAVPLDK